MCSIAPPRTLEQIQREMLLMKYEEGRESCYCGRLIFLSSIYGGVTLHAFGESVWPAVITMASGVLLYLGGRVMIKGYRGIFYNP